MIRCSTALRHPDHDQHCFHSMDYDHETGRCTGVCCICGHWEIVPERLSPPQPYEPTLEDQQRFYLLFRQYQEAGNEA